MSACSSCAYYVLYTKFIDSVHDFAGPLGATTVLAYTICTIVMVRFIGWSEYWSIPCPIFNLYFIYRRNESFSSFVVFFICCFFIFVVVFRVYAGYASRCSGYGSILLYCWYVEYFLSLVMRVYAKLGRVLGKWRDICSYLLYHSLH